MKPDGYLAWIWNVHRWEDFELQQEFDVAYAKCAPSLLELQGQGYGVIQREIDKASAEFETSDEIRGVNSLRTQHSTTLDVDEYVELLTTYSNHRTLDETQLEPLLNDITKTLSNHSGTVTMEYVTHALLAQVR